MGARVLRGGKCRATAHPCYSPPVLQPTSVVEAGDWGSVWWQVRLVDGFNQTVCATGELLPYIITVQVNVQDLLCCAPACTHRRAAAVVVVPAALRELRRPLLAWLRGCLPRGSVSGTL